MADERVFLNEAGVFVSNSRVVIAGTTYSMANITSVRKGITPPNQGCAIVLIIVSLLIALVAFGAFSQDIGTGVVLLLLGGGMLVAAILWLRSLKPTFHVVTASASGETQALRNRKEISAATGFSACGVESCSSIRRGSGEV